MTGRLERTAAATVDALRVLPAAGDPGYSAPNEIAAEPTTTQPLTGPHFERQVEHLHRLGPRAVAELLIEIAHCTGQSGLIADRLQAYAKLDPAVLRAIGGDKFPPMALELVR